MPGFKMSPEYLALRNGSEATKLSSGHPSPSAGCFAFCCSFLSLQLPNITPTTLLSGPAVTVEDFVYDGLILVTAC